MQSSEMTKGNSCNTLIYNIFMPCASGANRPHPEERIGLISMMCEDVIASSVGWVLPLQTYFSNSRRPIESEERKGVSRRPHPEERRRRVSKDRHQTWCAFPSFETAALRPAQGEVFIRVGMVPPAAPR